MGGGVLTGLVWLRTGTNETFRFNKMLGISLLAAQLVAPPVAFSSTEIE
jgi:hypothetical protein